MSLASYWGYFVHVFDWQPLSTSPCSGSPTPPSTLGSMGLSPGVDTPGGHDVFILSPIYGHRYSHMKYKMYEFFFHLACRCNCIPLFISSLALVLSHLERTIWIGVGLVCWLGFSRVLCRTGSTGGSVLPLLEEDSVRNTGLRRRDRTPTHSKKMQLDITDMQRWMKIQINNIYM